MTNRFLVAFILLALGLVSACGNQRTAKNNSAIQNADSNSESEADLEREKYYGVDVVAREALVKLERCDVDDPEALFKRLEAVVKERTDDKDARTSQVGNFCWYLIQSSKVSTNTLLQAFKSNVTLKFDAGNESTDIDIVEAEPNFIITINPEPSDDRPTASTDDDLFKEQWGLSNPMHPGIDIDALEAWKISTGSEKILVGVVDTGLWYDHPDLKKNVWSAPEDFYITLGRDTVHCLKGSHGYNAVWRQESQQCEPLDGQGKAAGHGTHVSGVIGAVGNNTIGVKGVNWTTELLGLKFIGIFGSGTIANAVKSIEFAVQLRKRFGPQANVRVLNASWGYLASKVKPEESKILREELERAANADIFVAASAGEDYGNNNDDSPHYPSSFYDLPNLVSVTAIDRDGLLAVMSGSQANVGQKSVHIAAPGSEIYSTYPPDSYHAKSGTSMATPFVSGTAALMLSTPECSQLHAKELKDAIINGAEPTRSLADIATGGRLNAYQSIKKCH